MNFSGSIVNTQSTVNSLGIESLNGTSHVSESNQPASPISESSVSSLNSDTATLTSAGAMVQSMNDSGMPTEHIASIQAAIATGTYNVATSAVAEKIVENMMR